jgi:hypothetical protein
MGRRSINGHSRRRRNKKASGVKMLEANSPVAEASSPLKVYKGEHSMKKDRRDQIIAGSALGPAGVLIAQNQQKKKINEETGEDFKTYRQAKWYKKNMDQDSESAWAAQQDEMEALSQIIPPGTAL